MKVELISYTKDALDVADRAASVCVGKEPDGKSVYHAMRSGHDSVLEHVSFTFSISGISRSCSHQLVRHRLASYSQQSQRYVKEDRFEYVIPETINGYTHEQYVWAMKVIQKVYDDLIGHGVPKEDARYVLPNACTTNLIMTMNARELRHFFNLRCCNRAQWEIRELAERMLGLCKDAAPELFADSGPSCVRLTYCPESRSCGRFPSLSEIRGYAIKGKVDELLDNELKVDITKKEVHD